MRPPHSYLVLLLFLSTLLGLTVFIQLGLLTIAFHKLGLSPVTGYSLFIASLLGSTINIPLFRIKSEPPLETPVISPLQQLLRPRPLRFEGFTIIAVNIGGCIIPLLLVLILYTSLPLEHGRLLLATALVTMIAYLTSRAIPGMGIAMPILIAPLTAALAAGLLYPEFRGAVAYISGTLGVLLGADLFRLKDIGRMGTPIASIGGAGTFDGIFLTGIIAALLA